MKSTIRPKSNGFGLSRIHLILCSGTRTFDDSDDESDADEDIDGPSFDKQVVSTASFIQRPRQGYQTRKVSLQRNVSISRFHFLFAAAARRRETLTTNRISSPINPRHMCMFLVSHEFLCRLTFLYLYTFSSCKNKCTSPSFGNGSFVKSTRTNSRYFLSIGKIQCLVDNAFSQIGRTIQCFSMRTNAR